jgi:hypothetical protein
VREERRESRGKHLICLSEKLWSLLFDTAARASSRQFHWFTQ